VGQKFQQRIGGPYDRRVNRVFVALVVAAVAVAILRDALPPSLATWLFPATEASTMKAVTQRTLDAASDAAKLALGLIGVLALWMGVMRVAERAGLIALLARALRPILVRLFPEIPADHPAMGAIVMNMSANMLGLGNAATPLGLEAMKRLQELNPHKKVATNAMVLFLALNTTHITLIPARTIALRLENGSQLATSIVLPTLLATACGTVVAFFAARFFQTRFPVVPDPPAGPPEPLEPEPAAPPAGPPPGQKGDGAA
jgi:spore maturation protein SpmA